MNLKPEPVGRQKILSLLRSFEFSASYSQGSRPGLISAALRANHLAAKSTPVKNTPSFDPRPELILFDAVGTLLKPVPSAGEVYRDYARQFDTQDDDFNFELRASLQLLAAKSKIGNSLGRLPFVRKPFPCLNTILKTASVAGSL